MLIFIFISILMIGLIIAGSCYANLVKTYKKYSKENADINSTSIAVISACIDHYNFNTKIALVDGFLTDFYLPKKDIIALSNGVAYGKSVADISVACHEFGHCLQKHDKSKLLKLSGVLGFFNKLANFLLPIALITCLVFVFIDDLSYIAPSLFYASVGLWFLTLMFRFVAIPVEMDASKRAYNMLKENNILTKQELKITKKVLNAAAFTYVGSLFKNLYKIFLSMKKAFRRD